MPVTTVMLRCISNEAEITSSIIVDIHGETAEAFEEFYDVIGLTAPLHVTTSSETSAPLAAAAAEYRPTPADQARQLTSAASPQIDVSSLCVI